MPTLESATAEWLRLINRSTNATTPAAGYSAFFSKSKSPYFVNEDGTVTALAAGAGDVVGPASSVDGEYALFDSTTGKLLKRGGASVTLAYGTYSPTLTNTTNVAASTTHQCQYMRVGNVVTVSGNVNIDPTAAGLTVLGISLPIASNFSGGNFLLGGSAATAFAEVGRLVADTTNNRATLSATVTATTDALWTFSFTYTVI